MVIYWLLQFRIWFNQCYVLGPNMWRSDGRCGQNFTLQDGSGRPGQCDPDANENSIGPCCSSTGFCGSSDTHCKRSGSHDFSSGMSYQGGRLNLVERYE